MIAYKTYRNCFENGLDSCIDGISRDLVWHGSELGLSGEGSTAFLPDTHWISGLMFHYAAMANNEIWNFHIVGSSSVQFSSFDQEKGYDWHIDTLGFSINSGLSRKLTVIIDFGGSSQSKGGDIEVMASQQNGPQRIINLSNNAKSSLHVFPAFLPWRLNRVIDGNRKLIVGWILGNSFI
jgi:hypothetical protein